MTKVADARDRGMVPTRFLSASRFRPLRSHASLSAAEGYPTDVRCRGRARDRHRPEGEENKAGSDLTSAERMRRERAKDRNVLALRCGESEDGSHALRGFPLLHELPKRR